VDELIAFPKNLSTLISSKQQHAYYTIDISFSSKTFPPRVLAAC